MALAVGGKENTANFHSRRKSGIVLSASGAFAGVAASDRVAGKGRVGGTRPALIARERREQRALPSPAPFVRQTARTYEIVWEISDILDQLYCNCECEKHLGHHTLVSCFVDSHAATRVDICQGKALGASQMEKGYGIDDIRRHIDSTYSKT